MINKKIKFEKDEFIKNIKRDAFEKIQEIVIYLEEMTDAGCLLFIGGDNQPLRFRVEREIRKRLNSNFKIESIWINEENLNLPRFLNQWRDFSQPQAYFIYGIERLLYRSRILQYLNFGRELLYDLRVPIIFWTTMETLTDLSRRASDFWAFKTGVYKFYDADFLPSVIDFSMTISQNIVANQYLHLFDTIETRQLINIKSADNHSHLITKQEK